MDEVQIQLRDEDRYIYKQERERETTRRTCLQERAYFLFLSFITECLSAHDVFAYAAVSCVVIDARGRVCDTC